MNRHLTDLPASNGIEGPRRHVPLWMLALFTLSGTLGMHIFVPALPSAAAGLHSSPGAMQLTISVYVGRLAIGQLVYGPVSDRFGRRPTLIGGLFLLTISGLAALFAQSVDALIVSRLFQALGGCAGLILARAIVRDTAASHEATRRLALMNLMATAGPGVAPLVGGALAGLFGWRSIFIALCALGALNALCAWLLLPETGARGERQQRHAGAQHSPAPRFARLPRLCGRRRLRDNIALCLHRLRAVHRRRPVAPAGERDWPLSRPPCLWNLARQHVDEPSRLHVRPEIGQPSRVCRLSRVAPAFRSEPSVGDGS